MRKRKSWKGKGDLERKRKWKSEKENRIRRKGMGRER